MRIWLGSVWRGAWAMVAEHAAGTRKLPAVKPSAGGLSPRPRLAVLGFLAALAVLGLSSGLSRAATLSWGAPLVLDGLNSSFGNNEDQKDPTSVVCPSISECIAVDAFGQVVTFDPNAPGRPTPITVDAGLGLGGLSCPSATQCSAIYPGDGVVTFNPTTAAITSTVALTTKRSDVFGLSCPSLSQCTAVGRQGEWTFDPTAPGSPTPTAVDTSALGSVACPTLTQCTAVEPFGGAEVTFNPTTGAVTSGPTAVDTTGMQALSCPTTSQCTATDNSGGEVTFTPLSPPATPNPVTIDSGQTFATVVCTSTTQCAATDFSGNEVTFDPTAPGTPPINLIDFSGNPRLVALACPATDQCTTVDSRGLEVTFDPGAPGGATVAKLDISDQLSAVACPTATQCTGVGKYGGDAVTFDPSAPTIPFPLVLDSGQGVLALACPTVSQCIATGDVLQQGHELTFDPTSPLPPPPHTALAGGLLNGVSCPSATQCTAIDGSGNTQTEVTFNPVAFSALTPTQIGSNYHVLNAIACPSTNQCIVVDSYRAGYNQPTVGSVMTFDPTAPGTPTVTQIDSAGGLTSVACPSASQCTAVDTAGNELTFIPTTPGSPSLNAVDGKPLTAVACPSISDCIAVDGFGSVVEGDPAHPDRWTVTKVAGANALTAVACSSIAQCVIVDKVGKGVVGTKSTSTSVNCAPGAVVVGSAATCTVTVSDVGDAPLTAPTGAVGLTSGGAGSFSGSGSCNLAPAGGPGQASCQLVYSPSAVGSGVHAIKASYSGDGSHPSSSASTSVTVTTPPSGGGGGGSEVPPAITQFALTNRTFTVGSASTPTVGTAANASHKQGTTFTYTISKAATAKIKIARRLKGRVKGRACVAPSRKLRKARSCMRIVTAGTLTRTSHAGLDKVAFSGRIGSSGLKPGNYQATVTATDSAGKASNSMTIYFTIAKR